MSKEKDPDAVSLGTKGGKVKSEKKSVAARSNGSKGGRPKMCECGHPRMGHTTVFDERIIEHCHYLDCTCPAYNPKN